MKLLFERLWTFMYRGFRKRGALAVPRGAPASRIAPDGVAYNAVLLATSRGEASAFNSVVQSVARS